MKLYDEVRAADLPQTRILEATRGAILARGAEGVPLLVKELQSADKKHFALGLRVARELPGREATEAVAAELARAVAAASIAVDPCPGRSRRRERRSADRQGREEQSPSRCGSMPCAP